MSDPTYSDTGMALVVKGEVHLAGHTIPYPNPAVIPSNIDLDAGQV